MNDPDSFVTKLSVISTSKRQSALYQFMLKFSEKIKEEFLKRAIPIITPTDDRSYFIISMPITREEELKCLAIEPGFILDERHIRIDPFFGAPNSKLYLQNLCSHWHYTEKYIRPNFPSLIIHVYFDHGRFLGAFGKYQNETFSLEENIWLEKMHFNCTKARLLIDQLLLQTQEYRSKLDRDLTLLLDKFDFRRISQYNEQQLDSYIKICRQTNEQLNLFLEGFRDTRVDLFTANLKFIRQAYLEKEARVQEKIESQTQHQMSVKADVNEKRTLLAVISQKSIPRPDVKIQAKRLLQKYKRYTCAEEFISNLKDKELILLQLATEYVTHDRQDLSLNKLIENIHHLPSLEEQLLSLLKEQGLQDVLLIYGNPFILTSLKPSFLMKFLKFICSNELNSTLEDKCVKVCQLLHERSAEYRNFISLLPSIFFCNPSITELVFSPFLNLVIKNRVQLYKTLVTHAKNPLIIALHTQGLAIPLLNYLMVMDSGFEYINPLLSSGAIFEFPPNVDLVSRIKSLQGDFSTVLTIDISSLSIASTLNESDLATFRTIAHFNSAFALGCMPYKPQYSQLLLQFAANSNLMKLLLGFAAHYSTTNLNPLYFSEHKMCITVVDSCDQLGNEQQKKCANYLSLRLSCSDASKVFSQELVKIVNERLQNLDGASCEDLTKEMLAFATYSRNTPSTTIFTLHAMLALLCYEAADLKIHKRILYTLTWIAKLLLQLAQVDTTNSPDSSIHTFRLKRSSYYYRFALDFANNSPWRGKLLANSSFREAQILLEGALGDFVDKTHQNKLLYVLGDQTLGKESDNPLSRLNLKM